MMCIPRRGFQATLITCIFHMLRVSIIAGRLFFKRSILHVPFFDKLV